jgi:hypothetical protein
MKKTIFTTSAMLLFCSMSIAQWTNVGSNGITTTKLVGIGMNPVQPAFPSNLDPTLYVKTRQMIYDSDSPALTLSKSSSAYFGSATGALWMVGANNIFESAAEDDLILSNSSMLHLRGGGGVNLNYYDPNAIGATSETGLFVAHTTGFVGIHTENPESFLHLKNTTATNSGPIAQNHGLILESNGWRNHDFALEIRTGQTSTNNPLGRIFTVSNAGTVHIGPELNGAIPYDPDGDFKLWVQGGVRTERLKIDIANNNGWAWPDYVFEEDYELMSFAELRAYVNEHKHLPNVPTEAEVMENGIDVAEMNKILLEKVEELTLHVLQLEERLSKVEQ